MNPTQLSAILIIFAAAVSVRGELAAGTAKVDITNREAGPVNDPLFAKALVLKDPNTTLVIVTVDAVAIGEIGYIGNEYLPEVRGRIERELGIPPENVIVNASHCHGVVCEDVPDKTVEAVVAATKNMQPVRVGAGAGREDRISENRRFKLKDGTEADSRHAYALPPDKAFAGVGPIDPEIGLLRIDALDGDTIAVVYNFACHPIQGVPSGGNTADLIGFASRVIEENAGKNTVALFLQGCAGDINPAMYKAVDAPRDAEPLGNMLGLSALKALRAIETKDVSRISVVNETIALPRANTAERIAELEAERMKLLDSLQGTTLNFKTFMPLYVKYRLSEDFPSHYAHRYMHEQMMGREYLKRFDEENRNNIQRYIDNIHTMEALTRLQTNLALLRKHQADNVAAESPTVDAEIVGVRIGDFALVTFPGELTVETGLRIKQDAPNEHTFVAGYTNGYLYYAPTPEQLKNVGHAQEDSDCILAPEWQPLFVERAGAILKSLTDR